jgi:hypothetical protein
MQSYQFEYIKMQCSYSAMNCPEFLFDLFIQLVFYALCAITKSDRIEPGQPATLLISKSLKCTVKRIYTLHKFSIYLWLGTM